MTPLFTTTFDVPNHVDGEIVMQGFGPVMGPNTRRMTVASHTPAEAIKGLSVLLVSYDGTEQHALLDGLFGKRVKITVEVVEG